MRGLARESEIGLHLAPFLRENQRQHARRPERPRHPREQPRTAADRMRGKRTPGVTKKLLPPGGMAVFDDGEAGEEVAALGVLVGGGELAVQPGGVLFIGVVLV